MVKRGEWKLIAVDGTETLFEEKPTIGGVQKAIGASCLDTVIIDRRKMIVMMVDDTGMCDGKPVNPKATALYRSICRLGTLGEICGDVAIVNDGDCA